MLRVDYKRWGQTVDQLRQQSLQAEHPRTRERFQALYALVCHLNLTATEWAQQTGRRPATVLRWVHRYNAQGPEAMKYRPSGGRAPLWPQI